MSEYIAVTEFIYNLYSLVDYQLVIKSVVHYSSAALIAFLLLTN